MLDSGFILKTALLLLLLSLLMIGEIYLIQFISEFWGTYFTLAITALTGLVGLGFSFRDVLVLIKAVKAGSAAGSYPEKELILLSGSIIGGILLLIPGFLTDCLGFLGFFPVVRGLYGRLFTRNRRGNMNELYEYLKLYE